MFICHEMLISVQSRLKLYTHTSGSIHTNTHSKSAGLAGASDTRSVIESMLAGMAMLAEVHGDPSIKGCGLHSHLHVALAPFWVVPCAAFPRDDSSVWGKTVRSKATNGEVNCSLLLRLISHIISQHTD